MQTKFSTTDDIRAIRIDPRDPECHAKIDDLARALVDAAQDAHSEDGGPDAAILASIRALMLGWADAYDGDAEAGIGAVEAAKDQAAASLRDDYAYHQTA